ncbi:WD40-repeat-containing domain protein [Choanephora cucurbitarum]|nr:WD40-repeat-containing domain protein [Choanephora cucurbitarum]
MQSSSLKRKNSQLLSKESSCSKYNVYRSLKQRSLGHPRLFGRQVKVSARPLLSHFMSPPEMVYQFVYSESSEFCSPLYCDFAHHRNDGNLLAVSDEDGRVSLLRTDKNNDINNYEFHEFFKCHQHAISDIKWSTDDRVLATASHDRTVRLWDPNTRTLLAKYDGHEDIVKSIHWHPTNSDLLVTSSKDGSFRVWDARQQQRENEQEIDDSTRVKVCKPILTVSEAHQGQEPQMRKRKNGPQPLVIRSVTCALYMHTDETKIISSGSSDGSIKLWDLRAKRSPAVLSSTTFVTESGKLSGVTDLKIDSTGTRLFSSCMDNRIYMHYLSDLSKPACYFRHPDYKVGTFDIKICLSPDDRFLASGSFDKHCFVWDTKEPERDAYLFEGHTRKVTGVSWNKYSLDQFATCSEDYTTRIWSLDF